MPTPSGSPPSPVRSGELARPTAHSSTPGCDWLGLHGEPIVYNSTVPGCAAWAWLRLHCGDALLLEISVSVYIHDGPLALSDVQRHHLISSHLISSSPGSASPGCSTSCPSGAPSHGRRTSTALPCGQCCCAMSTAALCYHSIRVPVLATSPFLMCMHCSLSPLICRCTASVPEIQA